MVNRTALALALVSTARIASAEGATAAPTATSTPAASAPGPTSLAPAPPATAARPLPSEPALHHVPLTVASEHAPIAVAATIDRPDLVRRAILVYRHGDRLDEAPFRRSAIEEQPYVAVIPADHVDRPNIAYAIELERTDSQRVAVFASRDQMQPVEVVGNFVDVREESLLARLHGRRVVTDASGEYAYFGKSPARVCSGACPAGALTSPLVTQSVVDRYWHAEAGITYRLLRTVSEFGIRGGVYRGRSIVPNEIDATKFDVGLNYGAPWVRLRATEWLHFEGELLTSVTEVGFSLGGGGAILLGDAYGSHLTLGIESIDVFGTRGYSRFDVAADRLRLTPIVEVTSMPHASNAGVRLLMDVGYDVGGAWLVTLRGGYQARTFDSGGPAIGAGAQYAF
jgi:hypothetical protein